MTEGASPAPLDPSAVAVHAVQFVGTNVEMTWLVDAAEADVDARLDALLASKLGLYALTRTGVEDGRARFSVIASPLDRLFHKTGPSGALTLIKHASVTLDLSETNLTRQAEGLARAYPIADRSAEPGDHPGDDPGADDGTAEIWRPWDAGKLLGTLLRRPSLLEHGPVVMAGVAVEDGTFPDAILPTLDQHVRDAGGVRVDVPDALRTTLAG